MKIVFIDDDRRRMRVYVRELEAAGHEVLFHQDVDSFLDLLYAQSESFDLVVLDISMPPGRAFRFADTDGGFRTGIALYDAIRVARPNLKVIVLTNVSDPRVAERFGIEDAGLCRFVRKPEMLPFQFIELVERFASTKVNDLVN